MPKHIYGDPSQSALWSKKYVGAGPYRLTDFDPGQKLSLVKVENWWGSDVPFYKKQFNFKKIRFRFIDEKRIQLELLKKGELDFVRFIEPHEYYELADGADWPKSLIKVKAEHANFLGTRQLDLNYRKPFFTDRRVRKALLLLFDRKNVSKKIFMDAEIPSTGPWHQNFEIADHSIKAVPYDREQAIQLLHEAGWEDPDHTGVLHKIIDGKKVDFRILILNYVKNRERVLTLFQEAAKAVGIDVQIKTVEFSTAMRMLDRREFDIVFTTHVWSRESIDPTKGFHSKYADLPHSNNETGYKNPELDRVLEQADLTVSHAERVKLLRRSL